MRIDHPFSRPANALCHLAWFLTLPAGPLACFLALRIGPSRAPYRLLVATKRSKMANAPTQMMSSISPESQRMDLTCINTIRTLAIDGVQVANSGHPGTPMALAPVAWDCTRNFLGAKFGGADRHRRRLVKVVESEAAGIDASTRKVVP